MEQDTRVRGYDIAFFVIPFLFVIRARFLSIPRSGMYRRKQLFHRFGFDTV
jgi:hypothetical protein